MRPNDEINTPNKFSDESGKHAKHKLAAFFVSSSQSEVFYKTLDIRKIHGKTPELIIGRSRTSVFFCKFCEIFKRTYFAEYLRTAACCLP